MARYPKGSGVRPRNKKGKQAQRRVPKEREDYGRRPLDNLDRALHNFVNQPVLYGITENGFRFKGDAEYERSADALVFAGVTAINEIKRARRQVPELPRLPKAHRETLEYYYAGLIMRDMNIDLNEKLNEDNPEHKSKYLTEPRRDKLTDVMKSSARSERRASYHNDIKDVYRAINNGREPEPVTLPQSKRRDGRVRLGEPDVQRKPPLLEATIVEEDGKPKYKKLPPGRSP